VRDVGWGRRGGGSLRSIVQAAALALFFLLAAPGLGMTGGVGGVGELAAQDALDRVESLLDDGRYGEARSSLEAWWEAHGGSPPRNLLARGLWLRALLTVDPSLAEMEYRRIVVEFPGSEVAEESLMRLARGAEFAGDLAGAERYLEILLRDYPGSPLRVEAQSFRDQLASHPAPLPVPAGELEADPEPAVESEIEPEPAVDPEPEPDQAPEPEPHPEPEPDQIPEPEPEPEAEAEVDPEVPGDPTPQMHPDQVEGDWAVQLAAYRSVEDASDLLSRLRAQGWIPRVVRIEGADLVRVRIGTFTSRDGARELAETLELQGFETFLVDNRALERPASP